MRRLLPGCLTLHNAVVACLIFSGVYFSFLVLENKYTPWPCPKQDEGKWSVGIVTSSDVLSFSSPLMPILAWNSVPQISFVADPFLFRHGETTYLFVELMGEPAGLGYLGVFKANDRWLSGWTYLGNALVEDSHLSYPHVFEADGEIYMMPETSQARQLRLYKAVDFPLSWKLETIIADKQVIVDATPFQINGRWWIFAQTRTTEKLLGMFSYVKTTFSTFYAPSIRCVCVSSFDVLQIQFAVV